MPPEVPSGGIKKNRIRKKKKKIKRLNLNFFFFRTRFLIKIHLVDSSKLEFLDFEMFILPHALHCVDSCISVFNLN